MDNKDKLKRIIENKKIKNRLYEAGIFPIQSPTGPRGKGIEILGYFVL